MVFSHWAVVAGDMHQDTAMVNHVITKIRKRKGLKIEGPALKNVSKKILPHPQSGWIPAADHYSLRNGLAVGGRFLVYDTLKTKISEVSNHQNLWWHSIVCGFSVGVFTTFLSQPADVIKSRMQGSTYNQRLSFIQVTGDIIRKEGFVNGMSRGLSARIWKIGFGQAVIFTVYESVSELLSRTMKV